MHSSRVLAPHVGVVANGCGEGQDDIAVEDRSNDEDIWKMHAASERIVEGDHVAGMDLIAKGIQDRSHRGW
jgi:hypothetical protein